MRGGDVSVSIDPGPTPDGPSRQRRNAPKVIALCVVCLAVSVGYVVRAVGQDRSAGGASATPAPLTDLGDVDGRPRLMFQSTASGPGRGSVGMAALTGPDGPRALVDLRCARVDYSSDLGLCLRAGRGLLDPPKALIFDASYRVVYTRSVNGIPSRVRVSPDGRWAATTSFIEGHSYADKSFSTETLLFDLLHGKVIANLESFAVFRDGRRFRELDFNFWGVTFAHDGNTFFATLGTGSHQYLVEGELKTRQLQVVRDGIECPSLSPDNTRVAFKKRLEAQPGLVTWQLSVLDLATLKETPVAESRNVDDQPAWLDDETVIYGLRPSPDSTSADTWAVPADGSGAPRLLVPQAWSTVFVER